ncbi:MAG: class I SAM-dependent methyltransferase, partial [Paracoccaceae bacterium]
EMPFDQDHLAKLNDYLSTGIHKVNGWCIPHLWHAIAPLSRLIGEGPIAEIGVFEGKFLIGLVKTFDPHMRHKHAAIDIYDLQQFNIDRAGVGKSAVLDANLAAHGIADGIVHKVRADSLSLRQADAEALVHKHGKFKFFSVDGCHEVTHTMNDIEFAMSVTDNAGIISVDDYLNLDWPGVVEAVAKMYLMRNFPFVPLLFTSNKLLLCSISHHAKYLECVQAYAKARHPTTGMKEVTRFGFRGLNLKPKFAVWQNVAFGLD